MYLDTANEEQTSETVAVGLGWFSIALGIAELAAPHSVARMIGVTPTDRTVALLRGYGAREVGAGLAILAQPNNPAWLWSRVAGDAVDLASLGAAMREPSTDRGKTAFATASVLAVTALDVWCAQQLARERRTGVYSDRRAAGTAATRDRRVRIVEAVTINQPIERVEERWSSLESMPESLRSLNRMSNGSDERSIVEFRQAPGGRGTEVRVEIEYTPRGGVIGAAMARVLGGDPTGQVRHDLRRFKQILETGEVVLSEGPSLWRPAQPAESVSDIRKAAGVGV